MSFYADTSFLFSYYASDANSARADTWRRDYPEALPFTAVHRLELRNAFQLAVFQSRITQEEANELWTQIEADLNAGLLVTSSLSLADVFSNAETIAKEHTAAAGSRSLDILHLSSAKLLGTAEVVTFDLRQIALANRLGVRVAAL